MTRIILFLLSLCFASVAHAQSGLLQQNQVWAGPTSGGQGYARGRALVNADIPGGGAVVNGVNYPASPSTNTVPVVTSANQITYTALPNCTAGTLQYSTTTHLFSCGAAGGTVSAAGTGLVLSGGGTTVNLALTNTSFSVPAATPSAASSATAVMIGAGVSNCKLTPTFSGRVNLTFNIASSNSGASNFGIVYSIRFGTGAAPAFGVAATGTAIAGPATYSSVAGITQSVTLGANVTGLTPGVPVWFDIAQTSNGTIAVTSSYNCYGNEF